MNPAKLAQALAEALALHQRGDLAEAEKRYRAILRKNPRHFDAMHLLGVLRDERGDRAGGIALIRNAIKIEAASGDAHFNLGRLLFLEGDLDGAKASLERAIDVPPVQEDKKGPAPKVQLKDIRDRVFIVRATMDGEKPVVTI
ncbi:MAG: tetratricopeptide repeat protein, partial [Rhodospirillaceae bacterium]|nr:tetratricopeptide repeat protein [Rhodospirillaceae bacterium]